jgi:hypothetical protein
VGAVHVVVVDVLADHAAKLPLVDRDDVVETIPSEAPDPALGISVLPRRPQSRADLFETELLDPSTEFPTVDRVIVPEQIARRNQSCRRSIATSARCCIGTWRI